MKRKSPTPIRTLAAFAAMTPLLGACSSSHDTTATTSEAGPGPGKVITLTGLAVTIPTYAPAPGVEGCVLDSNPKKCATSDANALLTISLPADSHTGLMWTPPNSIPVLTPIYTHEADIALSGRTGWVNMVAGEVIPNSVAQAAAGVLGVQPDSSKGIVDFVVAQLNGGVVTIEGSTTSIAFFTTISGTPALLSSVDGGVLPAGAFLLGFFNVEPGTVTFRAEKNGSPCEWDPVVWPGAELGTVTVPIRAGTWTRLLEAKCP